MFIYTATVTTRPGKDLQGFAQIVETREVIEAVTGQPTSAWAGVTGHPFGTFGVSTRVDSIADVMDAHQKLGASVEYATLAEAASDIWAAAPDTSFQRVIASAGETSGETVMSRTTAEIAGSYADAIAFGMEVLEYVYAAAGTPGFLTLSESNALGTLSWIFGNDSGDSMAASDAKMQQDMTYLAMYDRAADYFVPGKATRSVMGRVA